MEKFSMIVVSFLTWLTIFLPHLYFDDLHELTLLFLYLLFTFPFCSIYSLIIEHFEVPQTVKSSALCKIFFFLNKDNVKCIVVI